MTEKKVHMHYGALADPIEEQLNKQGFTLGKKLDSIEKLEHALTMCMFHLLTNTQYQSCLKKFHKKIISNMEPMEEKS